MKNRTLPLFVLLSLLGGGASSSAQPVTAPAAKKLDSSLPPRVQKRDVRLPAVVSEPTNFRVDVAAKYLELEGTARFMVSDGMQANFVNGGEQAHRIKNGQGEGVEFKKTGFIVNVLPLRNPTDDQLISVQLQVELSGPVKGIQVGGSDVPDIKTWQYQSSFTLTRGRKTVVVESPARLEVTIDRAD